MIDTLTFALLTLSLLPEPAANASSDPTAALDTCSPQWLPTFGGQPGPSSFGILRDAEVIEVGGKPQLFVAGTFTEIGGISAQFVARWDGERWYPLGSGMDSLVQAIELFDDGTGPALYAMGQFKTAGSTSVNSIAKWDGATWSAVGRGLLLAPSSPSIGYDLVRFDDGTGPALYAAGNFTLAGGLPALGVARWDGHAWSSMGNLFTNEVTALAVHDDGSGPALYAAGLLADASTPPQFGVARWDGSQWLPFGPTTPWRITALESVDVGGGAELYVGGHFTHLGGVEVNHVARWTGTEWAALGAGVGGPPNFTPTSFTVNDLRFHDDGAGPGLFVAGSFRSAGSVRAAGVARWDGASWSPVGSSFGPGSTRIERIVPWPVGPFQELVAVGNFQRVGSQRVRGVALWNGSHWSGFGTGLNGRVSSLAVFDDGSGPALYAGGDFTSAGGVWTPESIVKWEGDRWTTLGPNPPPLSSPTLPRIKSLGVANLGGGAHLYTSGEFVNIGGTPAQGLARWDGNEWESLGISGFVYDWEVFDDGSGRRLCAAGRSNAPEFDHVAAFDGTSWTTIGGGANATARALAVHDDGSGEALFVAGDFTRVGGGLPGGGTPVQRIAKWDGSTWSALGSGLSDRVYALASYDDGNGAALYAGGTFTQAGGQLVNRIARWDGSSWTPVGAGMDDTVRALVVVDLGEGPVLVAGGDFSFVGDVPMNRVAAWNGESWRPLRQGLFRDVEALAAFDDGTGSSLVVGGGFGFSEARDSYVARYGCR